MIVEGDIEGDVYASEETKLAHNAKVLGNIYTPLIDIDRGAKMSGRIINDELKNNID
jgi:cytoskeletal protein CcmA (bactofilin family)